MALSGITMTSSRDTAIDFLFPHFESSSAVIIKFNSFKWMYFLKPFSRELWLSLIALPFVVALVLAVMHQLLLRNRTSPIDDSDSVMKKFLLIMGHFAYFLSGALLMQGKQGLYFNIVNV